MKYSGPATVTRNKGFSASFVELNNPDKLDWICHLPKGVKAAGYNYNYGYAYTDGKTELGANFAPYDMVSGGFVPLFGETDFVLLDNDGYVEQDRISGPVVEEFKPTITLAADKATIKLGEKVEVAWNTSMPTDGCFDGVALVPTGQVADWLGLGMGTSPDKQTFYRNTGYQTQGKLVLQPSSKNFTRGFLDLVYVITGSPIISKKRFVFVASKILQIV